MTDRGKRNILTLDDLYHPDRKLEVEGKARNEWVWDGAARYRHHLRGDDAPDKTWWSATVASGASEPLFDVGRLGRTLRDLTGADETELKALSVQAVDLDRGAVLCILAGTLCLYRRRDDSAVRITRGVDTEVGAGFSPDGRWVSYVESNNLHVADAASGIGRRLTDAGSNTRLAGRLDWVYQEELYGRGKFKGYWWSPDSTRIAFLELDVSAVSEHVIPRYDAVGESGATRRYRYPRAGTPNPRVELGIVEVARGGIHRVEPPARGELLIVNVAWCPSGETLSYQVQDREQTWLELHFMDCRTGICRRVVRETSAAWVRTTGPPRWLDDGTFLWMSDRTGWCHLYRYGADGELIAAVTSGEWDVRELHGTDRGSVFFSATARSPISLDTYRARLDGAEMERLTEAAGTHRTVFAPDMAHFIDTWSDHAIPAQVRLHRSDGSEVRLLEGAAADTGTLELGRTEFFHVPARDGVSLEAMMIKPPGFDPNHRYPVLCHVYGGPMAPLVRNAWGGPTFLWHHMLASRGAIVWTQDPRTAGAKGVAAAYPAYGSFGSQELRDLEDGIRWLANQRYIDPNRIGIWGWSFGGFLAAYAMTHCRLFRLGIAGAPVTDWRLYDSIYTERYMRTPEQNPDGYHRSSVVASAAALHGKLMIVHGTADDNVHLDHSMRLVDELQRAGKDFEVMFYPNARHSVDDPAQLYDLRRRMTNFILDNL